MVLFIEYPKCTTCQRAKKWLDAHEVEYVSRHIKEESPTEEELKAFHQKSNLPLKRFFNTSGQSYRALGLKVCPSGNGRDAGEASISGGRYVCAHRL